MPVSIHFSWDCSLLTLFVSGSKNIATSLMWNWEPVGEGFRCVANHPMQLLKNCVRAWQTSMKNGICNVEMRMQYDNTKCGKVHGPPSLKLTYDKLQLSCLEPPSWCVTQASSGQGSGLWHFTLLPRGSFFYLLSLKPLWPLRAPSACSSQLRLIELTDTKRILLTQPAGQMNASLRLWIEAVWEGLIQASGRIIGIQWLRGPLEQNKFTVLHQIQPGQYQPSALVWSSPRLLDRFLASALRQRQGWSLDVNVFVS